MNFIVQMISGLKEAKNLQQGFGDLKISPSFTYNLGNSAMD